MLMSSYIFIQEERIQCSSREMYKNVYRKYICNSINWQTTQMPNNIKMDKVYYIHTM